MRRVRVNLVIALGAVLAGAVLASPAPAQECHPQGAGTLVTVTGADVADNRGATSPLDQFAGHQDLKWSRAHAFTADALAQLPARVVAFTLPYDHQRHVFAGPPLLAVLQAAGAAPGGMVAHGIDGYRMEFSAADLAALQPILALCRDGRMLGIGDLGPGFVVYPPSRGEAPSDDEFARMIWGVYLIEATP